jgi:hypothetical protein
VPTNGAACGRQIAAALIHIMAEISVVVNELMNSAPGDQGHTVMLNDTHQTTFIREMMEHLGIEPSGGVVPRWSMAYTTALHRCETCGKKPECRDWLDHMPAAVSFAPRFCPNADIFFELQVEQPRADRVQGCVAVKAGARTEQPLIG